MDKAIGNLIVTLSFDSSEFDSGISQAQRQLKNFERATRNSGEMAKQTGYSMNTSAVYVNNMKESYKAMNHTLSEQSKAYNELGDAHGKDSARRLQLGAQMEQTKAKMLRLNKEYERETMNIAKANSTWYQGATAIQNFGKGVSDTGQKMQSFGNQWSKASAVFTVAGGFLGKQAMDFERGMINVQKTTGQSDEAIADLGMRLRELSTEMPISIGQLQGLAEAGGRFQIPRDRLAEFAETMAKVGTATDMTAETAAEQFAKLSNITGLTIDEFENFGSSLVNLGNKTAAAESSIMNMAMGMAGTLSSLGMADQDILGLSAAMGSLGIESERGSSSISKFFVDLEAMVQSGAEELQAFADVAGMSMDEFSTSFKDNPTEAFQAFIDGLKEVEEQGGSIVNTLDQLGISEIRMRDTLLRLARGNKTLADSLEVSRDGWSENKALQEEYENQLKSTAAQWDIFKNKLVDVAISAGTALLPVFTELMDSSDVLIDGIKNLAEWFVNLDDSTKGFIAKAAIAGVALGPLISGFGTLLSFGGGLIQMFGGLNKGLSMIEVMAIRRSLGDLGVDIGGLATSTSLTTKALGGFKTTLSLLSSPIGIAAVAIAGLYGAYKIFGEEAHKAHQAAKDFPDITGLTGQQADSIREVSGSFQELDVALGTLGTASTGHADIVMGAVNNIVTEIEQISTTNIDDLNESLQGLPTDTQDAIREALSGSLEMAEQEITRAKAIAEEISAIYEVARAEQRELHDHELQRVMGLEAELAAIYSRVLGNSFEQQQQIYRNLTQGLADMTEQQLKERQFIILDYAQNEADTLRQAKEGLETAWQEGLITGGELTQGLDILETSYADNLRKLNISAVHTARERFDRLNEGFETSFEDLVEFVQTATGLGFDEVVRALQSETPNFDASIKNMVNTMEMGAEGAQEAGNKWNAAISQFAAEKGLTPDQLGTEHIEDFIKQVTDMGMTWEELELLSKDANVDDNLKEFINAAAEAQGGWDMVLLEDKTAVFDIRGEEALTRVLELFGVDFANLEDEQKTALIESKGIKELSDLLVEWGIWSSGSEIEAKQAAIETDLAMAGFKELFEATGLWNDTSFLSHIADIDTNAPNFMDLIAEAISVWAGIPIEEVKQLMIETDAPVAQEKIESVGRAHSRLDGRTSTVSINVRDNASYTIANVTDQIRALDGRSATTYVRTVSTTARRMYAEGTNFHPGGLAVLGDGGRQEPFLTPSGHLGLSPDRDTLYDLPAGTKVWSSLSKFISELPKYASGTQQSFLDKIRVPRGFMDSSSVARAVGNYAQGAVKQGDNYHINITVDKPTVSEPSDLRELERSLTRAVDKAIGKVTQNKKKGWVI